jgi:hypothetical protein
VKRLVLLVTAISAVACASTTPKTAVTPVPASAAVITAPTGLAMYEGTYALQGPTRTLDLRVWIGNDGKLNGELVGHGKQTTFRPTSEPHTFLHATEDDISFVFTVVDGRATALTMIEDGRETSGRRKD